QGPGHHQVTGDLVGELLGQALKLLAGELVQITRRHVVGDRRAVVDLLLRRALGLLRAPRPRISSGTAAAGAAGRAGTVTSGAARLAAAALGPASTLFCHRLPSCSRRVPLVKCSEAAPEGTASRLKIVRRRPTLPHRLQCSTIGAEGLDFRVRNVTGYFPFAMVAETLWRYQQTLTSFRSTVPDHISGTSQWTRRIFVRNKPSAY